MLKRFLPVFFVCGVFSLWAQEAGTNRPLVLIVEYREGYEGTGEDVAWVIDYTVEVIRAGINRYGADCLRIKLDGAGRWIEEGQLRNACRENNARFAVGLRSLYRDERLSWHYALYRADTDTVVAIDTFSVALVAGVSSIAAVDASAARLEQNWKKSVPTQKHNGKTAVTGGQRFLSFQEGLEVFYGSAEGKSAGISRNGALDGALVPFSEDIPVYGTVTKEGYWPGEIVLPEGITGKEVYLPLLQKKTRHSIGFFNSFRGGLEDYSVEFEYRFHVFPDRFFLNMDWSLFRTATPLSGGDDALHQELRGGLGLYLLPRNNSPFRLLAGTGMAFIFSGMDADFQPDPFWLGVEVHFAQWAIVSVCRFPALIGYTRDAFGGGKTGMDKYYFTAGVMLKW